MFSITHHIVGYAILSLDVKGFGGDLPAATGSLRRSTPEKIQETQLCEGFEDEGANGEVAEEPVSTDEVCAAHCADGVPVFVFVQTLCADLCGRKAAN